MPRKLLYLLPCVLLTFAGCGQAKYPVEGKVTIDGQPLKTDAEKPATVVLWPEGVKADDRSTRMPTAQISADGTFALYTEGAEGAPVGTYKVTVYAADFADSTKYGGKNPEKTKLLVPSKYTKLETTPLTIKVVQFPEKGAYDLKLTTK